MIPFNANTRIIINTLWMINGWMIPNIILLDVYPMEHSICDFEVGDLF